MMDNKMIVEGSLAPVEGGFSFLGRLPYYRGLGLSMIEDIEVTLDGEKLPRDQVRFSVRGKTYTLDEMETVYDDRWNFGEKASVIVKMPGGLAKGAHEVELAETLRISYLPFVPTTKCKKSITFAG